MLLIDVDHSEGGHSEESFCTNDFQELTWDAMRYKVNEIHMHFKVFIWPKRDMRARSKIKHYAYAIHSEK